MPNYFSVNDLKTMGLGYHKPFTITGFGKDHVIVSGYTPDNEKRNFMVREPNKLWVSGNFINILKMESEHDENHIHNFLRGMNFPLDTVEFVDNIEKHCSREFSSLRIDPNFPKCKKGISFGTTNWWKIPLGVRVYMYGSLKGQRSKVEKIYFEKKQEGYHDVLKILPDVLKTYHQV